MQSLSNAICNSFYLNTYTEKYIATLETPSPYNINMVIPTDKEVFEVPVFVFVKIINMLPSQPLADCLVVNLHSTGRGSTYSTVASNIANVFNSNYFEKQLVHITTKDGHRYYVTNGAIFNENFYPILLLSWSVRRLPPDENGNYSWQFIQPILRISPDVYLNKTDELRRYICNKILPEALDIAEVEIPWQLGVPNHSDEIPIKVEICDNPFTIKTTPPPTVNTTNADLLHLVSEHLDELPL